MLGHTVPTVSCFQDCLLFTCRRGWSLAFSGRRNSLHTGWLFTYFLLCVGFVHLSEVVAFNMVVTKLDTPKSDFRERTGTEWLVLGLALG